MKVEVNQRDCAQAITLASHFVANKAQLPILKNVLLDSSKTRLKIMATNLEMSLSTSIGAKGEKEGDIAVPAKSFGEILTNLVGTTVRLDAQKEVLNIEGDSFKGKVAGVNTADFPSIPQKVGKKSISIPLATLKHGLSKILFSVSTDEARPVLTGVLFNFSANKLLLVGSDGFRLSKIEIPIKSSANSLLVPKQILQELMRLSDEGDVLIEHKSSDNQILFGSENNVFSSRIIQGDFPNFEKIIPKNHLVKINMAKPDFARALKLAGVYSREVGNTVTVTVKKSGVTVSAQSPSLGSQETLIDAKVDGEGVSVNFNYRFLEEALSSLESDEVVLRLGESSSPGVFEDPKDSSYLHLIMPVKG